MKKILAVILVFIMTFALAACGAGGSGSDGADEQAYTAGGTKDAPVTLGEGETEFALEVITGEGEDMYYQIKTGKETVGDALFELDMIDGEQSTYGLYIKYVNGEFHDYEEDGTYWAFYVDGEYAELSADLTPIEDGKLYQLSVGQ